MKSDEKTIDTIIEENDLLRKQVITGEELLRLCMPFVQFHNERARFRQPSHELLEAIKMYLGE